MSTHEPTRPGQPLEIDPIHANRQRAVSISPTNTWTMVEIGDKPTLRLTKKGYTADSLYWTAFSGTKLQNHGTVDISAGSKVEGDPPTGAQFTMSTGGWEAGPASLDYTVGSGGVVGLFTVKATKDGKTRANRYLVIEQDGDQATLSWFKQKSDDGTVGRLAPDDWTVELVATTTLKVSPAEGTQFWQAIDTQNA